MSIRRGLSAPLLCTLSGRPQDDRNASPSRLSPEDCQIQSMPDASPVKWHLAHTTWFFETFVLAPHAPGFAVVSSVVRYLFNSYYNAVGDRLPRPRRGLITRPTLDEVYDYRAAIDRAMEGYLESAGETLPAAVAAVIELGLNHEQQHQELILTDIKHALAQNPLRPAYRDGVARPLASDSAADGLVVRCRRHKMDRARRPGFAFDNEGPRHRVYLRTVSARRRAGDERRVSRLHGRWRLRAARTLALRRMEHGERAGVGGPALLGEDRQASGGSRRWAASVA